MTNSPTAIRVASGRLVDLLAFKPEDVLLSDIAHSLARQERFTGHCPLRPTIAQHSLAVASITDTLMARVPLAHDVAVLRAALMHDAAEAYVSDLSTPMKRALRVEENASYGYGGEHSCFDDIETGVQVAINARFQCCLGNDKLPYQYGSRAEAQARRLIGEADKLAYQYESAYDNWNGDATELPAWLRRSTYIVACYAHEDGGEAAFLRRAHALGMSDYAA